MEHDEGWFKVSRRVLDSSRWFREDPATIKLLFFLIAEAQSPLNPNPGTVLIGDTGLASRTGLPIEAVTHAIDRLSMPDPESRSVDDGEGLTIERVPGGVKLVNFATYHPGLIESALQKKAMRIERARKGGQARWQKERERSQG